MVYLSLLSMLVPLKEIPQSFVEQTAASFWSMFWMLGIAFLWIYSFDYLLSLLLSIDYLLTYLCRLIGLFIMLPFFLFVLYLR